MCETLQVSTCKKIGNCVRADYHMIGYGFDYRFRIKGNKGLYVTKWATGTEKSAGFPDNWEIYELTFTNEYDTEGSIGNNIARNVKEEDILKIVGNYKMKIGGRSND